MSAAAGVAGRPAADPSGTGAAGRASRAVRGYAPAVLVAAGGLVAWELVIRVANLNSFILPAPSAIIAALVENWNGVRFPLWQSAQNTIIEAVGGFLIGTTAGVVWPTRWYLLDPGASRHACYPRPVGVTAVHSDGSTKSEGRIEGHPHAAGPHCEA